MITKENTYFDSYKKEQLKELLTRKETKEKQLFALEHIKRETKKDWSDFKDICKNFWTTSDLVRIRTEAGGLCGFDFVFWYAWDSINIKAYTTNEKFIEEIRKTAPERIISWGYLIDRVFLTAWEIMQEIQQEIERLKKSLENLNEQIRNFEEKSNELFDSMTPLFDFLEKQGESYRDYRQIAKKTIDHLYLNF